MKTIKDHHEAIHTLEALHDFIVRQEHVQYLYESSSDETEQELSTMQVQFVELQETNQHLKSENLQLSVQVDTMESELETQDSTIEALEQQLKHELGLRVQHREVVGNLERQLREVNGKAARLQGQVFRQMDTIEQMGLDLEHVKQNTPADVLFELEGLRETVYQLGCQVGKLQQQANLNRFLKA